MTFTVDGRTVYAYTGGRPFDAARPTVVFLHGAVADHSVWTLLARWLAHHGFGVLAVDLPGHMRSDGPALTSIEALADWTIALLDAAGVGRAALVGHSMGSLIALEAAARAPQRVDRLLMLGTCVPMPVPAALLEMGRDDPWAAIDRVVMFSFSTLAAKPSYPGPGTWVRGGSRQLMRQVLAHQGDRLLFHTDFSACARYAGGLDAASKVQAPASLVLARGDQMTLPRGARELAGRLRASVSEVPGGHFLMQEQPDPVLEAVRAALG